MSHHISFDFLQAAWIPFSGLKSNEIYFFKWHIIANKKSIIETSLKTYLKTLRIFTQKI